MTPEQIETLQSLLKGARESHDLAKELAKGPWTVAEPFVEVMNISNGLYGYDLEHYLSFYDPVPDSELDRLLRQALEASRKLQDDQLDWHAYAKQVDELERSISGLVSRAEALLVELGLDSGVEQLERVEQLEGTKYWVTSGSKGSLMSGQEFEALWYFIAFISHVRVLSGRGRVDLSNLTIHEVKDINGSRALQRKELPLYRVYGGQVRPLFNPFNPRTFVLE